MLNRILLNLQLMRSCRIVDSRYPQKRTEVLADLVHFKTMPDPCPKGSFKTRPICPTVNWGNWTIVRIFFRRRIYFWWNITRVSKCYQTRVGLTLTQSIPPPRISMTCQPSHITNRIRSKPRNRFPNRTKRWRQLEKNKYRRFRKTKARLSRWWVV